MPLYLTSTWGPDQSIPALFHPYPASALPVPSPQKIIMLPFPHLQTDPRLTLSFVEVFVTPLSPSINDKMQALEVWRHKFEGSGNIDK